MRKLILIIIILSAGFTASAQNSVIDVDKLVTKTIQEQDSIYAYVEHMPEFPGGIKSLMQYLAANIRYPAYASQQNIGGTVLVKFAVNKFGKISNIEVIKDIFYGCVKEAVRVVKSMPDWKPGMSKGEPVSVYYTLPVRFTPG